jgi:hypothetical protein
VDTPADARPAELEPDELATIAPEEMYLVRHVDVAVGNIAMADRDDPGNVADSFDKNVVVMRIKAERIGADLERMEPTTYFFVLDPRHAADKALDLMEVAQMALLKPPMSKEKMQELVKSGIPSK